MPRPHGKKIYCQVLIDPARYQLIEQQAKREGKRTTGFIREIVYENLEQYVDADLVRKAQESDDTLWEHSVHNRVLGRMKKKAERLAS